MLKRRLIPKLQIRRRESDGVLVLVTTVRFRDVFEIGNPVSQAKIYQAQAVDELIFLNLQPDKIDSATLLGVVSKAAEHLFMPITVGGGITCVADFRALLNHGADKVSINTAAVTHPDLISSAASMFGSQCVVVSIDYSMADGGWARVRTHSGTTPTNWEVEAWARECERRGAGEIMLTSIDRDGTRTGLDIECARRVSRAVRIPVILGGGCGVASHFVEGMEAGGAEAIAAGTYFCLQDQNPMQCRAHIKNAGLPIRLHL
jgi:cyclase